MSSRRGFIWRKDYGLQLESAVNHFNRQVAAMKRLNPDSTFTPAKANYNQIKFSVKSKAELDRITKSLNALTKESSKLVRLPGGIIMSKWQRREIGKKGFIANQRLAVQHRKILDLEVVAGFEKMGYKNKNKMPTANEATFRKRNYSPDKVSPDNWNDFVKRLEKQSAPEYLDKLNEIVQVNFYNAIYKVWGEDARGVLNKIDGLSNKDFMKIFNSNTLVDFDYVYRKTNDYDTRLNTLNKIFDVEQYDIEEEFPEE